MGLDGFCSTHAVLVGDGGQDEVEVDEVVEALDEAVAVAEAEAATSADAVTFMGDDEEGARLNAGFLHVASLLLLSLSSIERRGSDSRDDGIELGKEADMGEMGGVDEDEDEDETLVE